MRKLQELTLRPKIKFKKKIKLEAEHWGIRLLTSWEMMVSGLCQHLLESECSALPEASPGCSSICLDCICLSNCQILGHSDAYVHLEAVLVFTSLKKITGI